MEPVIREAAEQDIPELVGLLEKLFSIEEDFTIDAEKQGRGLLMLLNAKETCRISIAEFNQEVIGMCTAQLIISTAEGGTVAWIEDVVVKEGFRGKGLGGLLLSSIEKWAVEKGALRLQLLADRSNEPALKFYDKLSWRQTRLICLHKK